MNHWRHFGIVFLLCVSQMALAKKKDPLWRKYPLHERVGLTTLSSNGVPNASFEGIPCLVQEVTNATSPQRGWVPRLVIALGKQGGYVPIHQPVYPHPEGADRGWFWDYGFSVDADEVTHSSQSKDAFSMESYLDGRACTGADGKFSGTGITDKTLSYEASSNRVVLITRWWCESRIVGEVTLSCSL